MINLVPSSGIWDSSREIEVRRQLEIYKTSLSPAAADRLIHMFLPYLLKWVRFLTTAETCPEAPFQRFLAHYLFKEIPGSPQNKHRLFVESLRVYERDDLFSEICVSFLDACLKSENIVHGMPQFLAQRIFILIKDPLVFGRRCDLLEESEVEVTRYPNERVFMRSTAPWEISRTNNLDVFSEELASLRLGEVLVGHGEGKVLTNIDDLIIVTQREDGLLGVTLNPDWISGRTAGLGNVPEFLELSREDRELLLRHYLVKQIYKDIARDMGLSESQVMRRVPRAKQRLSESLANNHSQFK